jgi:hypothetical protein
MLTGNLSEAPGPDFAQDLTDAGVAAIFIGVLQKCSAQKADRRPKDALELARLLRELIAKPTEPNPARALVRPFAEQNLELGNQKRERQQESVKQEEQSERFEKQSQARTALEGPRSLMYICAWVHLLLVGLGMLVLAGAFFFTKNSGGLWDLLLVLSVGATPALANGMSVLAANRIEKLRNYSACVFGSITMMFGGLLCFVGVPIGIYCLVMLFRREIREAFDS